MEGFRVGTRVDWRSFERITVSKYVIKFIHSV